MQRILAWTGPKVPFVRAKDHQGMCNNKARSSVVQSNSKGGVGETGVVGRGAGQHKVANDCQVFKLAREHLQQNAAVMTAAAYAS